MFSFFLGLIIGALLYHFRGPIVSLFKRCEAKASDAINEVAKK